MIKLWLNLEFQSWMAERIIQSETFWGDMVHLYFYVVYRWPGNNKSFQEAKILWKTKCMHWNVNIATSNIFSYCIRERFLGLCMYNWKQHIVMVTKPTEKYITWSSALLNLHSAPELPTITQLLQHSLLSKFSR